MQKLVIIGAGGFAREVAWLVDDINADKNTWELLGFIDEDDAKYGVFYNNYPVLGDFDFLHKKDLKEPVYCVCAVGNPKNKRILVKKAEEWGYRFANLIHPSVKISKHVKIGVGNIICVGNVITVNVFIHNHVIINLNCTVGHDVIIDNYSTILPAVNISGNVRFGMGCNIGTNASIIQGVTVGEWSIIGAGATVTSDIPPNCTAVGVPAKPIKFHDQL